MLDWVLNTFLIQSSNVIRHAYHSIADSRFSGFSHHSYVCYVLDIRNGLIKNHITKTIYITSNAKSSVRFTSVSICFSSIFTKSNSVIKIIQYKSNINLHFLCIHSIHILYLINITYAVYRGYIFTFSPPLYS